MSRAKADYSGGSGPFNARYFIDASLPNHTIYAPKTVVAGRKLPLIVWGNGACGANGAGFSNFLTEIASHGFMIVANGDPKVEWGKAGAASLVSANEGDKTRAVQLTQSVDWAVSGAAGGKYGEVDMSNVAAAGQSCGGVQAYSAGYSDKRVKLLAIFNTGVIDPGRRWMLKELKQNVALFHGGKGDFAYEKVSDMAEFGEHSYNLFISRWREISRDSLAVSARSRRRWRLDTWELTLSHKEAKLGKELLLSSSGNCREIRPPKACSSTLLLRCTRMVGRLTCRSGEIPMSSTPRHKNLVFN